MGWKKFFAGEPMPDKNDPKYKERYEKEVAAGRRFGEAIGLAWLGRHIVRIASDHRKAFLAVSFGIVITLFLMSTFRLIQSLLFHHSQRRSTVIERVDSAMNPRLEQERLKLKSYE